MLASIALALVLGRNTFAATVPVTNTLDSGVGSLRNQVSAAPSGSTITFSVTGVITLTSGQISINKNLVVKGPGAGVLAVNGNNHSEVLYISAGTNVQIDGLTIENGLNTTTNGGGIENYGTLTVTNSSFVSNTSTVIGTSSAGGGIYNDVNATLTVYSSKFISNTADQGAGISNGVGTTIISNSTFVSNTANSGGGLLNYGGNMTVTDSLFDRNTAHYGGGAISNIGVIYVTGSTFRSNFAGTSGAGISSSGTLDVNASSFLSNTTLADGGGIYSESLAPVMVENSTFAHNKANAGSGIMNNGTFEVSNSTFFSNSATYGGGIYNFGAITLTFSTLVSNSATTTNGGGVSTGYLKIMRIMDTIVAQSVRGGDCAGTITSGSYNLGSDTSCAFTATHDISGTTILLGSLQNNGGPTLTIAPLIGSKAIDQGGNVCPATDQRGIKRPQGNACDIGAVELVIHIAFMPIVRRAS